MPDTIFNSMDSTAISLIMFKLLNDLIENHKFIRRFCLGLWLWLFVYATRVVFDPVVLVNITGAGATAYSVLVGVSGLVLSYYFKKRTEESKEK